jgi:uncharacterized Tic20 family protein
MSDDPIPPPPPPEPAPTSAPATDIASPPAPVVGAASKDEQNFAMFTHLAGLLDLTSIPGGGLIGPLVLWLIKKDTMPFVDDQGKEAVNFHITIAIALLVSWCLTFFCIGIPMLIAVGIASIVFSIIGAIAASKGEVYRYPLTLRLVK